MSFEDEYRELMAKPIDEIREDIFFRPDNFQDEPWYGDFQMYGDAGGEGGAKSPTAQTAQPFGWTTGCPPNR